MAIFATYAVYLAVSVALTIAVGSALSRSGRVFLTSAFGGDAGLARAVSRLLVTGFYLLSLGFIALTVRTSGQIAGPGQAFGVLFAKIGVELLVLAALQLATMVIFTRFRRRQRPGPDPVPGHDPAPGPGSPVSPGPGAVASWRPAHGAPSQPHRVPRPPRQAVH
jgi:hypothetical protein